MFLLLDRVDFIVTSILHIDFMSRRTARQPRSRRREIFALLDGQHQIQTRRNNPRAQNYHPTQSQSAIQKKGERRGERTWCTQNNGDALKQPLQSTIRILNPIKKMFKDPRNQQIPHPKTHRRSKNKPIPPRPPNITQHPQSRSHHTGEKEGGDAAEDGVGDGEEDAGDLSEDAEEEEEAAADSSRAAVCAARYGDDAVVLGEDGEGGDGEECGEETADAV